MNQRLDYLFLRYYKKIATDQERKELMVLLNRDENEDHIKQLIKGLISETPDREILKDNVADNILRSIFQDPSARPSRLNKRQGPFIKTSRSLNRWQYLLGAAVIAGFSLFASYNWMKLQKSFKDRSQIGSDIKTEVLPGKDRAQLALWDGTTVNLESGSTKQLSRYSGIKINELQGEVVYHSTSQSTGYNTLTTPLGGQYKIVLPDGSRAWLNAGSSIRFPNRFTQGKREVAINGEIYFEVYPNKNSPFIVQTDDKTRNGRKIKIIVLGTHFNVSCYKEEPSMTTTLIEGAVKIQQGTEVKLLRPGQQAQVSQENKEPEILIKNVDTRGVVAWTEGRFEFSGNIREIMRQIARWYDVDIEYKGDMSNKSFTGVISRKDKISEVLKILELTGKISFTLEGKRIIVKPSK